MANELLTQRVGRGGAGNFYARKDLANLPMHKVRSMSCHQLNYQNVWLKPRYQDIEAANSPLAPSQTQPQPQSLDNLRIGRGGAGNFIAHAAVASEPSLDPRTPGKDLEKSRGDTVSSETALRGYSGRGGAGNWRLDSEEEDRRRVDEQLRVRNIDEQVRMGVNAELKPPPKAHAKLG
jgi:Protein of unknown function (DUF3602)